MSIEELPPKRKSIDSLNFIRAVVAICVFMYHAYRNLGCNFYALTPLIRHATLFMTIFFMLSGFVLYYNYSETNFADNRNIALFIQKRILSIFPIYLMVYIIFLIFRNGATFREDVVAFPFQILLLQEFSHYTYLQNDGVWFFSCIFFCYLLFPYICGIVKQFTMRKTICFFMICTLLNSMAPLIGTTFSVNIYCNVFCRLLEFSAGVCVGKAIENRRSLMIPKATLIMPAVICIGGGIYYCLETYVDAMIKYSTYLNLFSMLYAGLLLYFSTGNTGALVDKIGKTPLVKFFSDISLELYACCGISFEIYYILIRKQLVDRPVFFVALIITVLLAVLFRKYCGWYRKIFKKHTFIVIACTVSAFIVFGGVKASQILFNDTSEYDFRTQEIDTLAMKGAYGDEGAYSWIGKEFIVRLKKDNASVLSLIATTLSEYAGTEGIAVDVFVDSQWIDNINITSDIENVYEIDMDMIWDKKSWHSIRLVPEQTFNPSEVGQGDNRDLSIMLMYIGIK